jgi:pyrimidine operon attenuation protein/uracil phosphoribosyltransferase
MAKTEPNRKAEREPGVLLDAGDIGRALKRIAHEIAERNQGVENVILVGIPKRGAPLAKRIAAHLEQIESTPVLAGALDIALYRDDYATRRAPLQKSEIPFDIEDKTVVLVDDVLFTGRSIRAALDALGDFGRPARVQLAVLVDRGHRELPIRADFIGKNIPTAREEDVQVLLQETDGEDVVKIEKVSGARF